MPYKRLLMEKASWTYLLLLGISIAYPLAQSFEKRVFMYRKFKFFMPGILFLFLLFIIWDILFTKYGIWGFNHSYTLDLYLAGLPLEEWLFFLVIPYCIVFLHEVLRFFVKQFYFPTFSRVVIIVSILVFSLTLPFVRDRVYTFTALAFVIPFLLLQLVLKTYRTWFSGFLLTYVVSLIPFLVVNGFLTRIPVVWYNNAENLSARITTIPVEDFIYLLGMLLPVFTIYQLLLHRYAPVKLRKDMHLEKISGF